MWILALAIFLGLAYIGSAIVGAGLRISRAIEAFTTFLRGIAAQRRQQTSEEYEFHD